jgi:ankyrin repeat protein
LAASLGHAGVIKLLLERGADLSCADKGLTTALHFAAGQGHADCVTLLLEAGADAKKRDQLGNIPLMTACAKKQRPCAELLLAHSDLGMRNNAGRDVLHCTVVTASHECFTLVLQHTSAADVDSRTTRCMNPEASIFNSTSLHLACERGLMQMSKALLLRGASRGSRDSQGFTPLLWAASKGHLACVTLLIGRPEQRKMTPAEVDAADDHGQTSLHHAAAAGHEQICAVLIEAGASLTAMSRFGGTPLLLARQEHPAKASLHKLLSGAGPAHPSGTVCECCGRTAAQAGVLSLKTCSACNSARYCSPECSAAAWREHRAACKAHVAALEEATRLEIVR